MGMQLDQVFIKIAVCDSYDRYDDIMNIFTKEKPAPNKIFVIIYNKPPSKVQKDNLDKLTQIMIDNGIYHHFQEIQLQPNYQSLVLKIFPIIYTKYRLNPWKIKNIPFGNHPLVVVTLNVALTKQKKYSIAIVSTMNLYLTKFTSYHKLCSSEQLSSGL
jgi:hypothetical protein